GNVRVFLRLPGRDVADHPGARGFRAGGQRFHIPQRRLLPRQADPAAALDRGQMPRGRRRRTPADYGAGAGAVRPARHERFPLRPRCELLHCRWHGPRSGGVGAGIGRRRLWHRAGDSAEHHAGRRRELAAADDAAVAHLGVFVFVSANTGEPVGGRPKIRWALAAARLLEQSGARWSGLPGDRAGAPGAQAAADLPRRRTDAGRSLHCMPDSAQDANAGRADRTLTEQRTDQITPALVTLPLPRADEIGSPDVPGSRAAAPPVLLFDHVSKWYGPVIGLNQVTLELRPGITGLVGHNGSGKSTLLRLAAGQIRPDLGSVCVAGHDAWTAAAKRHLGYCPEQDTFYEDWSGRRFLEGMASLSGYAKAEARRRTESTLALVGMDERADRPLAGYSKGMRQRIKLAQALLHDPALLLLDEPLSGIDPIGRRESIVLFQELAR